MVGLNYNKNDLTTSQRFELWRAEPNRFLIYLLNHSDTMSNLILLLQLKRIGAEV
jgi:hypothetical protein